MNSGFVNFIIFSGKMSSLVLGHSFVHRLHSFIEGERDVRTAPGVQLQTLGSIMFISTGSGSVQCLP